MHRDAATQPGCAVVPDVITSNPEQVLTVLLVLIFSTGSGNLFKYINRVIKCYLKYTLYLL